MITELPVEALISVRHLFEGRHLELVVSAVAAGSSHGHVWVDSTAEPRAALLWDEGFRYYLGGEPDGEFAKSVARLVETGVLPGQPPMVVYPASDIWRDRLTGMFGGREFAETPRRFYRLDSPAITDWRAGIPDGFSIVRLDEQLLMGGHHNAEPVVDEILSIWPSVEDLLTKGFGFCALERRAIVTWCTAEYVSGRQCGIGIETLGPYQGRGLATLTACAFAEHCVSEGIRAHWDCWSTNTPSVRVAEKVGFHLLEEYAAYLAR